MEKTVSAAGALLSAGAAAETFSEGRALVKLFAACAVAALAVGGIAKPAAAAVIYQTSFEQPEFQPGLVEGQNTWFWEGKIEVGIAHTGSQAIHIDGSEMVYQTPAYPITSAATGIYTIEAAYLRMGDNRQLGGLVVEGDTGFLAQIQSDGAGSFYLGNTNNGTTSLTFAPDVWRQLRLVLNFDTYQMSGSVDGIELGTLPINNAFKPTALSNIQFGAYNDQPNTVHDAWIDDVTISQVAAVPEPAA